jgi:hypothetical protein
LPVATCPVPVLCTAFSLLETSWLVDKSLSLASLSRSDCASLSLPVRPSLPPSPPSSPAEGRALVTANERCPRARAWAQVGDAWSPRRVKIVVRCPCTHHDRRDWEDDRRWRLRPRGLLVHHQLIEAPLRARSQPVRWPAPRLRRAWQEVGCAPRGHVAVRVTAQLCCC